jgi:hypothetical protein
MRHRSELPSTPSPGKGSASPGKGSSSPGALAQAGDAGGDDDDKEAGHSVS